MARLESGERAFFWDRALRQELQRFSLFIQRFSLKNTNVFFTKYNSFFRNCRVLFTKYNGSEYFTQSRERGIHRSMQFLHPPSISLDDHRLLRSLPVNQTQELAGDQTQELAGDQTQALAGDQTQELARTRTLERSKLPWNQLVLPLFLGE